MIVNRHDIEQLLDNDILPRLEKYTEYRVGKKLGYGHYGFAYELQNDAQRTLKITADRDEARTSSKLVGKTFKHVVSIYKVFEFKTLRGAYFLIEERLQPLNAREANVVKYMGLPCTDLIQNLLQIAKKRHNLKTLEGLTTYTSDLLPTSEFKFLTTKLWPVIQTLEPLTIAFVTHLLTWRTVSEFQKTFPVNKGTFLIMQKALIGLKEMEENDITFHDTQSVNLMKNSKGIYKWIDLGAGSGAPGEVRIEQTEGQTKEKHK